MESSLLHSITLCCLFFLLTSSSAEPYKDKQALLDFLHKIHRNSAIINWNQSRPLCTSWTGVKCNHDKTRVTSLYLQNLSISGSIPVNTLSRLTALVILNVKSNSISGNFPPEILKLRNLTSLNLAHNRLSGSLPSSISNLTRLITLDLSDNSFTGELPSDLHLPRLKYLNLSNNNLHGRLPMSLRKFPASVFSGNDIDFTSSTPADHGFKRRHPADGGLNQTAILGICIGACFFAVIMITVYAAAVLCSNRKKSMRKITQKHSENQPWKTTPEASGSRSNKITFFEGLNLAFDLEDLLRSSAEVLGKGTCGATYKAAIDDSTAMAAVVVVVKRLKEVSVGKREFQQVMEGVGMIRHDNVVPLRAYYYSREEKLVVYDYYTLGSVSSLLHGNNRTPLDWEARLKIAIGAARGLAHIHTNTSKGSTVIHGNIKSSNIFLNTDLYGCVSELGISAIVTPPLSTPARSDGFRAPELIDDPHKLTQSSDVYSFGVFLLELLTGKSPVGDEMNLVNWVNSVVREEWTAEVFDVELLRCPHVEEEMVEMLQVGLASSCSLPEERPRMVDLVRMVEEIPSGRSGGSTPIPIPTPDECDSFPDHH